MHDFIIGLSQFILSNPIFDLIIILISVLVLSKLLIWYPEYKKWSNELSLINAEGDIVDDDSFAEFENKIKASSRVNSIITIIRDFVTDSVEISVNDIHVLVSEKVRKPEHDIIMYSSFFLFTGLIFTVYGIFTALQGTFGGTVAFDEEIISKLLKGFEIAFSSTIIGIFCAFLSKLAQLSLEYVRQPFEYNIKLYAKNVLIPRIGIPEVEKNLGKVVRTLSNASTKLEEASLALIEVSHSARTDTEEVTKTVDHFHETLEVMGRREDSLITAYEGISQNLFSFKDSLNEIVAPLDQIRQDMISRDHQVKPQLELIKQIYDTQIELDSKLSKSVKIIEETHKKLGNFFGKDFPGIINKAIDKMLKDHDNKVRDIYKKVQSIHSLVTEGKGLEASFDKLESIIQDLGKFKTSIKSSYSSIEVVLNNLKADSDKINSALEIDGATIGKKILSIDKFIRSNNKIITILSTTTSKIEGKVQELISQGPFLTKTDFKEELTKIEGSLGDLSGQIKEFAEMRESINKLLVKMNKLKQGKGIISSIFGVKSENK